MNALQEAFHEHHALQCGFCTPGMLMTATDMLKKYPLESDDDIREGLSGNLCRCTGYEHIVAAIRALSKRRSRPDHDHEHALSIRRPGAHAQDRSTIRPPTAARPSTLPVSCVLLRHRQGNVLFDTGCHPSVAENPEARWGDLAQRHDADHAAGGHVVTGLAGVGLATDDIDVVVCSHLHPDHCGCNAFFKRATFVIHAREIEAARAPEAEMSGYLAPNGTIQ